MFTLTRWNPWRMTDLNRELDSLFTEYGLRPRRYRPEEEGQAECAWLPAVDLSETPDAYVAIVELPGVAKEDVKVTWGEDVLTVAGEKKIAEEDKGGQVFRRERLHGAFARSFRLPGPVAADRIKAEYRDGVLTLTVPKAEDAKPKEIRIQ